MTPGMRTLPGTPSLDSELSVQHGKYDLVVHGLDVRGHKRAAHEGNVAGKYTRARHGVAADADAARPD